MGMLVAHRGRFQSLHAKMCELVRNMKALHYMCCCSSDTGGGDAVVFNSWPVWRFYDNCRLIVDMFSKEFMLKMVMCRRFLEYRCEGEAEDEDGDGGGETESGESTGGVGRLNKYSAVWLHQPHIDTERSKLLLDAMLIEADLK